MRLTSAIPSGAWVLDHPMRGRFDGREFARSLEEAGFRVAAARDLRSQFAWFVADRV
jgi:hypothetical protein